ncbi:hypothetical protein F5Y16DRAFT_308819 [Xylariaceae sp. FL0255]|nr:hypothetical protein F5Y16DRAFT_308819 [Xylariaceae sp. FL0255]
MTDNPITASHLTRVGLGCAYDIAGPAFSPIQIRIVVLSAGLLACGASSLLYYIAAAVFEKINWRGLLTRIIRAAEYSRWFFTIQRTG